MAPAPVVPVAPVFTWSGFYLGISGGGIFGDNRVTTAGVLAGNIANVNVLARPPRVTVENDGYGQEAVALVYCLSLTLSAELPRKRRASGLAM